MVFRVVVSLGRSRLKLSSLALAWLIVMLRSRRCDAGVRCDGPGWGGEVETTARGGKSPTTERVYERLRHCRCISCAVVGR